VLVFADSLNGESAREAAQLLLLSSRVLLCRRWRSCNLLRGRLIILRDGIELLKNYI